MMWLAIDNKKCDAIETVDEYETENGNTVVHVASIFCDQIMIKDDTMKYVDYKNKNGWTSLFMASFHGNQNIMLTLSKINQNSENVDYFNNSIDFYQQVK